MAASFLGTPRLLSAGTQSGVDRNIVTKVASNTANDVYLSGSTNVAGTDLYGITGLNKGNAIQDGLLLRFNSSGVNTFYRLYSGNAATTINSVQKDPTSESMIVVGQTLATGTDLFGISGLSPSNANGDVFLAKYNDANTLQWSKVIGGTGAEDSRALFIDALGNIYWAGTTSTLGQTLGAPGVNKANSSPGGFVVKISPSGTTTWGAEYSESGYTTTFTAVTADVDGNIIMAGTTNAIGTNLFGIQGLNRASGNTGILIIKQNPTTNAVLWAKILTNTTGANEAVNGLVTDSRKNVYFVGNTRTQANDLFGVPGLNKTNTFQDGYIVMYDLNGTPQWGRLLPSTQSTDTTFVYDLAVYPSGRLILSGSTNQTAINNLFGITNLNKTIAGRVAFIISYDREAGTVPWSQILEGGGSDARVGFLNQYKRLVVGLLLTSAISNVYSSYYGFSTGVTKTTSTVTDIVYIVYQPELEPPSIPLVNPRPKTRNQQITYFFDFEDWTTVARFELTGPDGLVIPFTTRDVYFTFTGLTNGQEYGCSIVSYNSNNTPSATVFYNNVIPGQPCQPPTNVVWTQSGNMLSVTWDPPSDDGGSPVDWYVIQTRARTQRRGIEPWRREYTIAVPSGTYEFELRAIADTGYGNPALSGNLTFP
jgi:hypothetical protein